VSDSGAVTAAGWRRTASGPLLRGLLSRGRLLVWLVGVLAIGAVVGLDDDGAGGVVAEPLILVGGRDH